MKMKKKILATLAALLLSLAMLPATAFAAGDVAQIGDTTYTTLDEAVTAATNGDTITVLADCETAGLNLRKDLTIKGAEGVNPTITFNTYGIALWGKALTFEDCTVKMNNITSTPYTGEWNWMAVCASTNASLTLNNTDMSIIADSTSTNNAHCIYFCSNNKLNLTDSTLTIKNYKQDALEWDGGDGGYNINFNNSTFISDHNRSGFTGTFYATITNSDVQVINSLGNGSNGSHFIITNSNVNFSNNGSHGLSTGILTVTDSTITANNNGMCGIIFNNTATFKNANVTITGTKGTSYWNAGMRAYNVEGSKPSCTIDENCTFRITDNYVTGIFLDASTSLNIAEGADVLVVRNEAMQKNCSTEKGIARKGGGIMVRSGATATLSSTTLIYNNHAALAGDDIYLESDSSSITFQPVGSKWSLDGTYLNGDTHCKHDIDGWYNDGYTAGATSARWEADAANTDENYISLYDINDATSANGILALKAAHGVDPTTSSDPDENGKTSLPGLEKSIVTSQNDEGVATATTSNATAAASDKVTFELVSIVPETLKNYIEYVGEGDSENVTVVGQLIAGAEYTLVFHDTLDSAFSLDKDSIVVRIGDTVLSASYYNVAQNEEDNSFTVTLHLLDLYINGIISEEDFGLTSITVTYDTTPSSGVTAGTYYNKAYVTFNEGKSTEDTVEVDTYGLSIFKYDQSKASASNATDANAAANLKGAKFKLSFDYDGTDVIENELVSGEDGYIILNGLDVGTYYLTETEAPEGFVCSSTPIEITISEGTSTDNVVYVVVANAPIPSTGGAGTRMYLIGGACLIAAAGTVFIVSRRKKDE